MKILVLGAAGMLGHVVLRVLCADPAHDVTGTVRGQPAQSRLDPALQRRLIGGVDAERPDDLVRTFAAVRPDAVINCIGLVKQLAAADDPLQAVPVNTLLPHRLVALCELSGARLVHISTDCVFSGRHGPYGEADVPDAHDLYGRSKLLGEVDARHAITLRTSIIGPELSGQHGLLGWFLAQRGRPVNGYRRAIFSGLPTVELATAIRDHVLPRPDLHGLYHVAAAPISKFELLRLIAAEYALATTIVPVDEPAIDRSLEGGRFAAATGHAAPPWPELIRRMRDFG